MQDLSYLSDRALRGELAKAMAAYSPPAWLGKVLTHIPNGPNSIRLPWLGGLSAGMAERTGSGKVDRPGLNYIDMDVVEYEDGIEIPLKFMRRDQVGILTREKLLGGLARSNAMHLMKLAFAAIVAGTSTTGYDSQYIFDTDHTDPGAQYTTNQSNKINQDISAFPAVKSGSTTVPSIEDLVWAISVAIQTMAAFKDDKGEYVNEDASDFVAFFPHTMWSAACAASRSNLNGYGASNMLRDFMANENMNVEIVASPRLSSFTASFVVLRADAPQTPMVALDEALEPEIANKIRRPGNSDEASKKESVIYEVRANRVLKFGNWRNGIHVTLT